MDNMDDFQFGHKKNGDFFIKRDFVKDDFNQVSDSDYANKIMANLKKYWSSIDLESKENIWKYLQVLLVLYDYMYD